MDTNVFDTLVRSHINEMKQHLRDSNQAPTDICKLVSETIFASVGQIIFGVNTDVTHIRKLVEGNLSNNPVIILSGKLIPECIKPKLSKYVDMSTNLQKTYRRILDLVHHRRKHLDLMQGFMDIIDGFLHIYEEIQEEHECSSKPGSPFVDDVDSVSDEQLTAILMDCYQAGMESTTAQMFWVFLYLARYPHVQRKIQEEMDRVIGPGMMIYHLILMN